MKRIAVFLITLALLLLAVMPVMAMGVGQDSQPVPTLPDWAVALLSAGLTFLVTAGLKSLSEALPFVKTLEGPATAVVAALVGFVVVFGNGLLAMIPPEYHAGVIAFFGFVGTLLSAYGVQGTLKMFKAKK